MINGLWPDSRDHVVIQIVRPTTTECLLHPRYDNIKNIDFIGPTHSTRDVHLK